MFHLETLATAFDSHICDTTSMTSAVGLHHPRAAHLKPVHTLPHAWDWVHLTWYARKAAAESKSLSFGVLDAVCSTEDLIVLQTWKIWPDNPGTTTKGGKPGSIPGCQELSIMLLEMVLILYWAVIWDWQSSSWFSADGLLLACFQPICKSYLAE